MHKRVLITLIAVVLALPAAAADFDIDTAHSSVSFKVAHMVVSKTRGSFTDFTGTIHIEDDVAKSSVEVTIDVNSIDTANEDRDKHLRGADFFDAENFPTMTFKSVEIKKLGSRYFAHGDLTIKGTTRRVALPFTITGRITDPWGNERIGIDIEPFTINRQDYGISFSKVLEAGGLIVGNEITIDIDVEAVKAKAETKAAS